MNKEALDNWAAWVFIFYVLLLLAILVFFYWLCLGWLRRKYPGLRRLKLKAALIGTGIFVVMLLLWQAGYIFNRYFQ